MAIAFFDVDETLIATKSMFEFLGFLGRRLPSVEAEAIIADVRCLAAAGVDRTAVNLAFWRGFAGLSRDAVRRAARLWVEERCAAAEPFFVPAGLDRLETHQRRGDRIALVSGSAIDILQPLAERLGIDGGDILATRLMAPGGIYSGEIVPPVMIGTGKRDAAAALARSAGADLADCHAYGDHISDLPMLELAGHPAVVGTRGELADIARRRGWPILPGHLDAHNKEAAA